MNFCKVHGCRYTFSHTTYGHTCGKCKLTGHGQYECGKSYKIDRLKSYYNDVLPEHKHCEISDCKYKWSHMTIAHNSNNSNIIKYVIKCPLCRKENKIKTEQKKVYGLDNDCIICLENKVEIYFPDCGHVCICYKCLNQLDNKIIDIDDIYILSEHQIINSEEGEIVIERAKDIIYKNRHLCYNKIYTIIAIGMGCCWYIRQENNRSLEGFFMHSDMWGQYGPLNDDRPKMQEFINGYAQIR